MREDAAHLPRLHHENPRGAQKAKLEAWNRNKEDARAWLALNMVTEARAGFTAFNEGPKDDREVDFILLRQKLAAGQSWVGPLHDQIQPKAP